MTKIQLLALCNVAISLAETKTRNDGKEFVAYNHQSPQWSLWLESVIHAAHADGHTVMLPDDYRYSWSLDIFNRISEIPPDYWKFNDNDEIEAYELQELITDRWEYVPIYTHELTSWLASRTDRYGYCDEWLESLGACDSTIGILQGGYATEFELCLNSMVSALCDVDTEILDAN